MSSPSRILLADDHRVVRRGLRLVLDSEPDLRVVAEADDGAEALALGLRTDLDLAVLDITMPRMTGLQAGRELIGHRPRLPVIFLSMHDGAQYLQDALDCGAAGYVPKSLADTALVDSCRGALRGESFYPASAGFRRDGSLRRAGDGGPGRIEPLTDRELQIVKLIAESHSGREIAGLLTISEKTVERHRSNILSKLGMRDRVELTRYAIRRGLVEP